MDLILRREKITDESLKSLCTWAEDHATEQLGRVVMMMAADLLERKPLTIRTERTEGFANPETATVARIIDNNEYHLKRVQEFVSRERVSSMGLKWLGDEIEKYTTNRLLSNQRYEVGSFWRVNWREIAEHVSAE